MALYIGTNKVKVNMNDVKYRLNLYSTTPIINGVKLLSSDNYVLKDKNGKYLTAKEGE